MLVNEIRRAVGAAHKAAGGQRGEVGRVHAHGLAAHQHALGGAARGDAR